MYKLKNNFTKVAKQGFTIVELLIVIVVIGILAAISIVSYTGIQGRAKDTQRLNDVKTIVKALEVYKVQNGRYPGAVATPNASGWELSTTGDSFLSALKTGEVGATSVPVDPANKINSYSSTGIVSVGWTADNWMYTYALYSAGNSGCDATKGQFYVLIVTRMDTVNAGESHPDSPGFACSGRNWRTSGAYVTGAYVN